MGWENECHSKKRYAGSCCKCIFYQTLGCSEMVISSGIYKCDKLDGFAAVSEDNKMIGLVTYIIRENECEMISLDSIVEDKGVGSALLKEVEKAEKEKSCSQIKLITTNDNLHALKFYQKKGYRLANCL